MGVRVFGECNESGTGKTHQAVRVGGVYQDAQEIEGIFFESQAV